VSDKVKHPSHYVEGRKFEPKDVIRDWGLNFNLGSAVKYLARAGRKADTVEDLKKAQEFIQFEIEAIEAERSKQEKPKAPQHPNCRCAVNLAKPVGDPAKPTEMPVAHKVGVIGLEVPMGTPREQIIKMVIDKICRGG
jgi:hypothetical protein